MTTISPCGVLPVNNKSDILSSCLCGFILWSDLHVLAEATPGIINEAILCINNRHHDNWIKVFKVMILLAGIWSPWGTLNRNVASIDCPLATRKLPKCFHINHFVIKILDSGGEMFSHWHFPQIFYNCFTYLFDYVVNGCDTETMAMAMVYKKLPLPSL